MANWNANAAAAAAGNKNKQTDPGPSSGGGGAAAALSGVVTGTQKSNYSDAREYAGLDKNTDYGNGPARTSNTGNAGNASLTATPNNNETYDPTGRPSTLGTSAYVADPSVGQIVGNLLRAVPIVGTLNTLGGLAADAISGENPFDSDDGGLLGRLIDGERGVTPGAVTGYTGNSVASNSNSRATSPRPADDTRPEDAAFNASLAQLTGGVMGSAPADGATGTAFSDVMLADRRKPKSDLAGTSMLMGAL